MIRRAFAGLKLASALLLTIRCIAQDLSTVYPHSIIPGGVTSPERYAEQQGRADVGFLWPQYLQRDLIAYVNYREGNSVRWTTAKVTIRKGELVFKDKYGHMVRGRCGNSISMERPLKEFTPPDKVDLDSPEVSWVAPPVLRAELGQELPFEFAERWPEQPAYPEVVEGPTPRPRSILPFTAETFPVAAGIIRPARSIAPGAGIGPIFPIETPEPATMWLLLSAAAFLSVRKLLSPKSRDRVEEDRRSNLDVSL